MASPELHRDICDRLLRLFIIGLVLGLGAKPLWGDLPHAARIKELVSKVNELSASESSEINSIPAGEVQLVLEDLWRTAKRLFHNRGIIHDRQPTC